jgi:hypothetical protein
LLDERRPQLVVGVDAKSARKGHEPGSLLASKRLFLL